MNAPPDGPRSRDVTSAPVHARRLVRSIAVVVVLGALAYTVLFAAPGFDEAGQALGRLRPMAVVAALVAEATALACQARIYGAAAAAVGVRLPYRQALNVSLSALTASHLFPAGGAVGAAVATTRMIAFGAPQAAGAAAAALTGTLNILTLAVILTLGLVATWVAGGVSLTALLGAIVAVGVLTVVAGLVLVVVSSPTRGGRLLDLVDRAVARFNVDMTGWRSSLADVAESPPSVASIGRIMAWAAIAWLADAAALWAVFAGLGEILSPGVLLLGFSVEHVAVMVPISPGGLGLVEAGMAGAFTALGVSAGTAVTAVVGFRIVSYWIPVAIGVPVLLRRPAGRTGGRP